MVSDKVSIKVLSRPFHESIWSLLTTAGLDLTKWTSLERVPEGPSQFKFVLTYVIMLQAGGKGGKGGKGVGKGGKFGSRSKKYPQSRSARAGLQVSGYMASKCISKFSPPYWFLFSISPPFLYSSLWVESTDFWRAEWPLTVVLEPHQPSTRLLFSSTWPLRSWSSQATPARTWRWREWLPVTCSWPFAVTKSSILWLKPLLLVVVSSRTSTRPSSSNPTPSEKCGECADLNQQQKTIFLDVTRKCRPFAVQRVWSKH